MNKRMRKLAALGKRCAKEALDLLAPGQKRKSISKIIN